MLRLTFLSYDNIYDRAKILKSCRAIVFGNQLSYKYCRMMHRREVADMLAVQGYYDGQAFQPLEKAKVLPNQKVIITIMDEFVPKPTRSEKERLKLVEELCGSLAEHAMKDGRTREEIMATESKAWEQAVSVKYGHT